jgi:hypothetical protein
MAPEWTNHTDKTQLWSSEYRFSQTSLTDSFNSTQNWLQLDFWSGAALETLRCIGSQGNTVEITIVKSMLQPIRKFINSNNKEIKRERTLHQTVGQHHQSCAVLHIGQFFIANS